jgi:integral membrane sensor domain MASE1
VCHSSYSSSFMFHTLYTYAGQMWKGWANTLCFADFYISIKMRLT